MPEASGAKSPTPYLIYHKLSFSNELRAAAALLVILVLIRFKAIAEIGGLYLGGYEHDAGLYVWLMHHNIPEITEWLRYIWHTLTFSIFLGESPPPAPDLWFNTPAFYPYGRTLAWSDNFILPSALGALLTAVGAPLVVAYNLVLLGAIWLNGFCTYRLSYRLCGNIAASLVAGIAFMSCSFIGANLGHPQLVFLFWIPVGVSLLFSFLATRSIKAALLFGLTVVATFTTTVYYAIFLIVAGISFFAAHLLLRPKALSIKEYLLLGAGAAIGLIPLVPFLLPYLDVRATFDGRHIYEAYYFSASILGYLAATPLNFLYGWSSVLSHAEAYLLPGMVLIAAGLYNVKRLCEAKKLQRSSILIALLFLSLSICTIWSAPADGYDGSFYISLLTALLMWGLLFVSSNHLYQLGKLERNLGLSILTNRSISAIIIFIALIFLMISFGPLGNPENGEWALGLHRLLYELMPGFDSIRAVGRSGVVVILMLALSTALAITHLIQQKKLPMVGVIVIAFLTVCEGYISTYPLEGERPRSAVFQLLDSLPNREDAVIVLPMAGKLREETRQPESWTRYAQLNVNYMNWVLPSGRPLINGYSGQRTRIIREYPAQLQNFPDVRSLAAIRRIAGLRYIVYVSEGKEQFYREGFLEALQEHPELRLLADDPAGNFLLEFTPNTELIERSSKARTELLMPPNRKHVAYLHLKLRTPKPVAGKLSIVDLYLNDDPKPYSRIELAATAAPQQFSVQLPHSLEAVRPVKMTFGLLGKIEGKADDSITSELPAKVYLVETRYQVIK